MDYHKVQMATFLQRPNRFVALCLLFDGTVAPAHLPNTGRCQELLVPGCRVFLRDATNPARKTPFTLFAVDKDGLLINLDSQAPNQVVGEALRSGALALTRTPPTLIRPEAPYDQSRLDFYLEAPGEKLYVEVKGVTLEDHGVVRFPDAPTLRGLRHVQELERAVAQGFSAALIFVVQMDSARYFTPNHAAQPQFGPALLGAQAAGVRLLAFCCDVTPLSITLAKEIPILLK